MKYERPDENMLYNIDSNELIKKTVPNLRYYHPIFDKFFHYIYGECSSWSELPDGWEQESECDKWKYLALVYYSKWLDLQWVINNGHYEKEYSKKYVEDDMSMEEYLRKYVYGDE